MNKTRILFVLVFAVLLTIRDAVYYLPVIAVLWYVAGRDAARINKKVILSIILFNSSITIGYMIMAYLRDFSPFGYLVYINAKVYTVTFFVVLFFQRVNLLEFFSFSRTLSYLLTLTLSMVYSYMKTFEEFRLSVKARGGTENVAFLKRVSGFFFEKAMIDSGERALAMRARGFFDD